MVVRIASLLALTAAVGFCGDWNPRLAADYLDGRQKAWFAWPAANKGENGVCLSCHTGLTYLLARPALSHALGENGATPYETQLLDSIKKRVGNNNPKQFGASEPHASEALRTESVLSALLLARVDASSGTLSPDTEQAFDRMWTLQLASGDNKGAWIWNSFGLDPWEEPESMYYGAALAALAVGVAPADYRSRHNIRENLDRLRSYLTAQRQTQPVHNQLLLVWASTKLSGLLSATEKKAIVDRVIACQQSDGGWALESLGPWRAHGAAAPSVGSNSYATGFVAFILRQAGVSRKDLVMNRALAWLRSHQDPKGFWDAKSMNKEYPPDSMPMQFMRDAATSYASLALVE
ncbi:MAG TPA: hypothetical protein VGV35_15980 [Bryobacteraceae bacterium]|nr:hypothetical protein [Bryobacteraceae bacterium]